MAKESGLSHGGRASESKSDGFSLQPALHGASLWVLLPATGLPGSFGLLFFLGLDGILPGCGQEENLWLARAKRVNPRRGDRRAVGRLTGSTSLAGAKAPCQVVSGGPVSHQHHSCVPMHLQGEMSQGPLQAVVLGPLTGPKEALPSTTERLVLEVLGSELSPLGEALSSPWLTGTRVRGITLTRLSTKPTLCKGSQP